ncbi:exodeoxyribonuclease V subunit gamma [Pelodictyon luteolum]|uniref:RecBCD enzyme subunit RecC n=1 Tax=Chlorobium luteolum (strain DSM 273 / BCRC 81028 / 2530) TaxID=319225 RepID=Q3B473_CHLL3|nr:exodeoxyribonuclease V subunit gamma [Pelodictyon luteolum]ABB23858.1 DNA helicase/exodeoxyribonuclease V, gamma subunit [Pelodictyon luteolum DSM 273]
MAFNIHTSNRTEVLAADLASYFAASPPASPFSREVVVVQSRGMQRWLSMELARRLGVWAGARYPFPNAVVSELFRHVFPSKEDEAGRYDPECTTWSIMRLLPSMLRDEPFAILSRYLSGSSAPLRLYQLATKIADSFDQYTLFRPEMLALWEAGEGTAGPDGWQSILWRRLNAELGGRHRGILKEAFCRNGTLPDAVFPRRIALFGISYLPQFHLDILSAIARHREVNLFVLSPTEEYWGDIVSRRTLSGMTHAERELHAEGNPLLASLGRIGRDFSDMVLEIPDEQNRTVERYIDPRRDTLLHAIQSDILTLSGTGEGERPVCSATDRSVQVHACHSPQREVEVLHDRMLDMLESIPGLAPRDIVVMAPDIETYSPFITAVFGSAAEGRIPFSVADRRLMNEGEVSSAVLRLLELHRSRASAPELFDLLSSPPVARRFGLDVSALQSIRGWIVDTRIRWGIDEEERSMNQLPAFRQNTWRAGIDRLLLGYAMDSRESCCEGILPFEGVDGGAAETIGLFADFIDAVDRFRHGLSKTRTLEEWRVFFISMLEHFMLTEEDSTREFLAVQDLMERMGEISRLSAYHDEVPPEVVIAWLQGRLQQKEQGLGFMTGGVTFCSMLPMRSVPFRVVVMLGMDDGAFPRQQHPPGFDLISRHPKRADRSVRAEDRYLFLETILSARDVLYISFVGRSRKDSSPIPPSVLVSELFDAIDRGFLLPEGVRAEEMLLFSHPLQPFSPACFSAGGPLFSYSEENFLPHAEHSGAGPEPLFMDSPLPEPGEPLQRVELMDLIGFYDNPSAFFLRYRLGLQPAGQVLPLDEREPFGLDGLDAYRIRAELAEAMLLEGDIGRVQDRFRAEGVLPPALSGDRLYQSLLEDAARFVRSVQRLAPISLPLPALDFELPLGPMILSGRLEGLRSSGQLFARPASMKARERMRSWIFHLVLCSLRPEGVDPETLLIMNNGAYRLRQPEAPGLLLQELLERYRSGQRMPLAYFPETSFSWEGKLEKGEGDALKAARGAWRTSGFGGARGEGDDPAFRRCFGEAGFDSEAAGPLYFRELAAALVRPVLQHSEAVK